LRHGSRQKNTSKPGKIPFVKPDPGTYVLILQSFSTESIQVGRWGQLDLQEGNYIYVGSAFGPGGVRARLSRHLREDKRKHWHIDYLHEHVTPVEAWVSYEAKHLEHEWAQVLNKLVEVKAIQGFGCSDCSCSSHLFYLSTALNLITFSRIVDVNLVSYPT
jgi:Uri superfamily endonuclease